MSETPVEAGLPMPDPHGAERVRGASGVLALLNAADILAAADVHVATRVSALLDVGDEAAVLALALTVRAARLGSSCLRLETVAAELGPELERHVPREQWPADLWPDGWWDRVVASALVTSPDAVLVAEAPLLTLQRYHRLEVSLSDRLAARAVAPVPELDTERLGTDLDRLFEAETFADQRAAAELVARSSTSVVTGGPGTGKTTTIARVLAALAGQHGTDREGRERPLSVALAAPTGKAAARMREAVAQAAEADVFTPAEREWLATLDAVTLHRLLGPRPDSRSSFVHHAGQKLAHDVVVVDETSMVSLLMMERLVQATSADTRLVLVGDADQLASVEAGAVLRDVAEGLQAAPHPAVATLRTGHRFTGAVGALASAVVGGDAEATLALLRSDDPGAPRLVDHDAVQDVVAGLPVQQARSLAAAAADGDAAAGLVALGSHRLLCAHRDGPWGLRPWNEALEREVRGFADPSRPWFVGRPVLVTRNDPGLGVHNGDTGLTVERDGRLVVELDTGRSVAASRLPAVQTAYASTVHRSQGSEYAHVTVLLPQDDSPILTRELLYTAITRTRGGLTVVADEDTIRRAVERRTARASGIARRLSARLGGS
ncbi:exodeoxyribonuclease V subunit alpha [Aeromicrobium halocynthiae]|uniref:RecBCD enzyme subunit RecD n=1 Tax=Aeromicrobium halocynthiae TaxID=560557 RepID=A0ABN2VP30_9ACTN